MQDRTIKQEEETYINPISFKSFVEMKSPVLDSEGFLREKGEDKVNLGIYSRKPVTITESSDLRKIQKDYRSLEEKMDTLMSKIDGFMEKSNQDQIKWEKEKQERDKKWEETTRRWETERNEMTRKWAEERAQIRKENQDLINGLRAENALIEKEVNELKEELEEKNVLIARLKNDSGSDNDTDSDNEEIEVSKSAPPLSGWRKPNNLPPEAKWIERNTLLGIKHTFLEKKYKKEEQEYKVRAAAYYGDAKIVKKALEKNKEVINTRAMPDAFTSSLLTWQDKTSLMLASQRGHLDIVKLLLKEGAHVNYLDRDKMTALDYAEMNKHHDIAILLKENGAENGRYLKDVFENNNHSQSSTYTVRPVR